MSTTLEGLDRPAGAAPTFTRQRLVALAVITLMVNAVAPRVAVAVTTAGIVGALENGFGYSWALWLAFGLCVRSVAIDPPTPADARTWFGVVACIAIATFPTESVSVIGATALGLWLTCDASNGPRLRAGGMILLAIAFNLLWSRLFMLVFAALDARMVGVITGSAVQGNAVRFLEHGHRLVILQACTSVQNASVALMLFVALVRTFRPLPRLSEAAYFTATFAAVVAINLARLSLMSRSFAMYEALHGPSGAQIINLIITATGVLGAALSVRREILD